jgi:hypothetical protein
MSENKNSKLGDHSRFDELYFDLQISMVSAINTIASCQHDANIEQIKDAISYMAYQARRSQ